MKLIPTTTPRLEKPHSQRNHSPPFSERFLFRVFRVFRGSISSFHLAETLRRVSLSRPAQASLLAVVLTAWFAISSYAQDAKLPGPIVTERGLHHRVIQTTNGGSYTELGTGMHYVRDGQLLESKEEVLIDANGYGVADQGQHSARFSPSITDSPAVVYTDPEGNQFRIRPTFLAYFDYSSGRSVLFCETKPSIGSAQSNTVTYADAFTDNVLADVIYRYNKGSFEADIAIRSKLPPVSNWSLNEKTVRLQVWHELFDPPTPKLKTTSFIYREPDEAIRQSYAEPDFTDDFLSFGTMQLGRGTAFLLDSEAIRLAGINVAEEVPVAKQWVTTPDPIPRHFIVESVELSTVQPLLDTLPTASITKPADKTSRLAAAGTRPLPERARQRISQTRSEFLASLPPSSRAGFQPANSGAGVPVLRSSSSIAEGGSPANSGARFQPATLGNLRHPSLLYAALERTPVLRSPSKDGSSTSPTTVAPKAVLIDFTTVITQTNYTFKSDVTYYVSSTVSLSGTNLLESTVIKFAKNAGRISITGSGATLVCTNAQFRPSILTAEDDQTIGESVSDNNSAPVGYYGTHYLHFDYASSAVVANLANLRIGYAKYGLYFDQGTNHTLIHGQISSCQNAIGGYLQDIHLRNVLVNNSSNVVDGNLTTVRAENCTVAGASYLAGGTYMPTLLFTNCLVSGIYASNTYSGANNANINTTDYQTVIGAAFLLANNSTYRNAGTTNINPGLLADLQNRTTYPPLVITATITNDTVLNPQAGRDTDTPDQGYHYDPLDWILSGGVAITNATLTLANSVAVGVSGTVGLKMRTSSKLAATGVPTNLVRLVRLESVQESGGSNITKTALFADDLVNGTQPEARLSFSELSLLPAGGRQFSGGSQMGVFSAQDCRFYSGGLTWNANGASTRALSLTNNLFERTTNTLGTGSDPLGLHARNNLFRNGGINFKPVSTNTWTWYDNVFDGSAFTTNSNTMTNDYNGYLGVTELAAHGTNDVVTNLTWQTWSLGVYYQPISAPFLDKGSRYATNAGLYHFCTTTNQVKEATSMVDIGLHYVALDANGNPDDADGDGIPDYLEDLNGNGSVDSGETDWQSPSDLGLRVQITRPTNNSNIP